jgi:hypothetical protein
VVRSSPSRTGRLYPQECSWYSFSLGAESTPGPRCGRKETCHWKIQWHHRESIPGPSDWYATPRPHLTGASTLNDSDGTVLQYVWFTAILHVVIYIKLCQYMSDKKCLRHQVYGWQGGCWYGRFVRNKLDSVSPDSTWRCKHILSLKRNGRSKGMTIGNTQKFCHARYFNCSAWIWYCLWDCDKLNTHVLSASSWQ